MRRPPAACPAQPHIKVDKDNPYAAEIRIMAEMQLARRNNCSPFLLQVPWGKHNPVDWRGLHAAQGLEGVDVDGVLPVVVVKDPFTWMRSMCRARPVFFSSVDGVSRGPARRHGVRREVPARPGADSA